MSCSSASASSVLADNAAVATGLDYFGARYFSAAQGRFTTPDWSATPQPVPYADLKDPQTLNLYGYVRNNPLKLRDFDGHEIPATYGNPGEDWRNTANKPMSETEVQMWTGALEISSAVATFGASVEALELGNAVTAAVKAIGATGLSVSGSFRLASAAAGSNSEDVEKAATPLTTATNPAGMTGLVLSGGNRGEDVLVCHFAQVIGTTRVTPGDTPPVSKTTPWPV